MTKYIAFLRGIGPGNPNMHNEKLRGVFEELGFSNVKTVISSGNVLFETSASDAPDLEAKIEAAFPERLGFQSTTIIRSHDAIRQLVEKAPFKRYEHGRSTYLTVTFLKQRPSNLPDWPADRPYKRIAQYDREVCAVSDATIGRTADFMVQLERWYGKNITTRTWNTVERILKNLDTL